MEGICGGPNNSGKFGSPHVKENAVSLYVKSYFGVTKKAAVYII